MGVSDLVRRVYEVIAVSYGYLRRRLWAPVGAVIRGRGLYIDGGCGPGQYSLYAAERFGVEVVCLDIAFNMVDLACRRARNRRLEHLVHCVQADILKLPFRDHVFHGAFYIASIHHVPGFRGRLRCIVELLRVVEKRARILVTVWSLLQPRFIDYLVKWAAWRIRGFRIEFGDNLVPWRHKGRVLWRYYHLFTLYELKRLMGKVKGLKCVCRGLRVRSKVFPENYYCLCILD